MAMKKVLTPLAKAPLFLIGAAAISAVMIMREEASAPLLSNTLRSVSNAKVYVPSSLDAERQRRLTLDLGGGRCKWQPPDFDVKEDIDFHKTLVAGYPSGDKRMIFMQMEALTALPAKDEWDFEYLGITNHPFIKANYPHHEGIWGWGDVADQMVLMIRNMRRSMVEYHDILWDIDYAKTWEEASLNLHKLYAERAPIEAFFPWRDDRVMDEILWYGWEIDYWMEGGLLRDMFTHGITTPEHFALIMDPRNNHRADLEAFYAANVAPGVANGSIAASYDTNCANGFITDGCEPVAVFSAEKLRDYVEGPAETEAIANVLLKDNRTGQFVISPEAWHCVWEELIMNGKGLKTVYDRPGFEEDDYNFSEEMLELMLTELDRLINKYDGPGWNAKATANRVVELLTEHRALIQIEYDQVVSGERRLAEHDFLGPKTRKRMALEKQTKDGALQVDLEQEIVDHSDYFKLLDKIRWINQQKETIHVLDRLIAKYGSGDWSTKYAAKRVVKLLTDHRTSVQVEMDEVVSGVGKPAEMDFRALKMSLSGYENALERKVEALVNSV